MGKGLCSWQVLKISKAGLGPEPSFVFVSTVDVMPCTNFALSGDWSPEYDYVANSINGSSTSRVNLKQKRPRLISVRPRESHLMLIARNDNYHDDFT